MFGLLRDDAGARWADPRLADQMAETTCHDTGRPDRGISAAADADDARQPSDRARTAGTGRRRNTRLRRDSGQAARGSSQGWLQSDARRQSLAVFLRTAGTAACRRRAPVRQCRPDPARFAVRDLGMDQPRPAADHGARLYQADRGADHRRQSARSPQGCLHVPDQGRQISREHAEFAGSCGRYPRQARGLYGVSRGVRRPHQDDVRATRARRAGEVQRRAAGIDPEVRRRAGRQDGEAAGCVQKGSRRCGSVRAGADRQAAQDAMATDPPRHQGRSRARTPPISPPRPMQSRSRWCWTGSTTGGWRCASR